MDELDWVPLSERHLKIFGACDETIGFLKRHNMINKPAGEIRKFLLTDSPPDKRDEWYQQWVDTRHKPETYEKISRRIMRDYIKSKKYKITNRTNNFSETYDTLEQAQQQLQIEKEKFAQFAQDLGMFNKDGRIYDMVNSTYVEDVGIAKENYIKYNTHMFYIEEEIETIYGDVASMLIEK